MRIRFTFFRLPTALGPNRRRNASSLLVLLTLVVTTLFPLMGPTRASAAGTSYGGAGGGGSGGLSGLPVLGVHSVGATATTLTFNITMATVTVRVPARTFVAHSQIAILNAMSLAHSPVARGTVAFAYDIVGKSPSGTFLPTFPHAISIAISSILITGHQSVFKLVNSAWSPFTPTTNINQSLSYYEASGLIIEVVNPGVPTTTTTHPRATTTTTRPRSTTTTRPRATTTTTRPRSTTTTSRPRATTTTTHRETTTTRPRSTTTTKPTTTTTRRETTTTRPRSTTTTTHRGTTTTRPKTP